MKIKILLSFLIFYNCSLYNIYGLALSEQKENSLSPKKHINYKIKKKYRSIPKSIILIIADGTGIGQYTLSYYANGNFSPSRFDHIGLVTTHPNDGECSTSCKRVTDSAASGTALSSGKKTYNGAIAVDLQNRPTKTILEWAQEQNMSTGLVATSSVTHATPASFGAHIDYRKKEYEIASQYANGNIDVILGGGKKFWSDSLINIFTKNNGQFIQDLSTSIDFNKKILGLFSEKGLPKVNQNRKVTTTDMAKLALKKLELNNNGFFIMIEESQVDWGGHANSANYIQGEMKSLNDLVNYVLDYQLKNPDVLVILTSDHECGGVAVHDHKNGDLDIRFTSDYHSANFVPIWASGPGASVFDSFIDNTEIGLQLIKYIKN